MRCHVGFIHTDRFNQDHLCLDSMRGNIAEDFVLHLRTAVVLSLNTVLVSTIYQKLIVGWLTLHKIGFHEHTISQTSLLFAGTQIHSSKLQRDIDTMSLVNSLNCCNTFSSDSVQASFGFSL